MQSYPLRRLLPIIFAFLFITSYAATEHLVPLLKEMKIRINKTHDQDATLPFVLKSNGKERITLEGELYKSPYASSTVKIIPDDCITHLEVNKEFVNVGSNPDRCDWAKGAIFDLNEVLQDGDNTIKITVMKRDHVGGINFFGVGEPSNTMASLLKSLSLLFFALLIITLLQPYLRWDMTLLLVASSLLQLHYLSYTDFSTRTFDLLISTGHLDYIKMIAHDFQLPNPTKGWEYHQPPLYYLIAAAFYAFFEATGFIDPLRALQLLSLILFVTFSFFSLRILQMTISTRLLLLSASALLLFWPSGIIHSIRIGNDILFFTMFSVALFYIFRWQLEHKPLWPALLLSALALISKSNGVVLFGIIGIVLLIDLFRTWQWRHFLHATGLALLFFLAAFLINFADNIYYAMQNDSQDWLVSNVVNSLNRKLFVDNTAYNYLYFDLHTYVKEPFTNPWNDEYGRQYFWNYLFKTSLFSEFFFDERKNVAIAIGFLSLPILGLILLGLAVSNASRISLIMSLALFISLLALIVYRIKIPAASNNDFRYVFPVLIPMAYFYAVAIDWMRSKASPVIFSLSTMIIPLFILLTISVFV